MGSVPDGTQTNIVSDPNIGEYPLQYNQFSAAQKFVV